MNKWYRDWRSWVTIVLLLFAPTFFIGIIVMWMIAPWSRRIKWWITGIGIVLPLLLLVVGFFLITGLAVSPSEKVKEANDRLKIARIKDVAQQANKFCLAEDRCAVDIQELQQKGYLRASTSDAKIIYYQLDEGKDCSVQTTLSSNEIYKVKCFPERQLFEI